MAVNIQITRNHAVHDAVLRLKRMGRLAPRRASAPPPQQAAPTPHLTNKYITPNVMYEYILTQKCTRAPRPRLGVGHVVLGHREVPKTPDNFVRMARHVLNPYA